MQFGQSRTLSAKHFFPHHPGVTKNGENMRLELLFLKEYYLSWCQLTLYFISCDRNMSPKYECISWKNTPVDSSSIENNNAL